MMFYPLMYMLRGVEADIYNGDHKIMFYFDCTYIIKIAGVIIIRSEGCFSYYYIYGKTSQVAKMRELDNIIYDVPQEFITSKCVLVYL